MERFTPLVPDNTPNGKAVTRQMRHPTSRYGAARTGWRLWHGCGGAAAGVMLQAQAAALAGRRRSWKAAR